MSSESELDKTVSRQAAARAERAVLRSRLTVVHPRDMTWSLELHRDGLVIGRSPGDGIAALAHGTVSKKHLRLQWDGNSRRHVAVDLGSHNGTRVDGRELADGEIATLEDNAVVQIGDVLLVYERLHRSSDDQPTDRLPGSSVKIRVARTLIGRAAADPSPVLIVGETGTGKEWAARALHERSGRNGPLVAVNCAALSPQLIESQLFGHVKGAFTGAATNAEGYFRAADGGTLFLDEIGELPAELQPKLLRVLQEGEVQPVGSTATRPVDVRIVAATNRDLSADVRAGRFRRDLYARIALWEVVLPPLRERRYDLLDWIDRLHRIWSGDRGFERSALRFTPAAVEKLLLSTWDENLRGVDRLVHALGSADHAEAVDVDELPPWVTAVADTSPAAIAGTASKRRPAPPREEFIRIYEQHDGNVSAIAKHLRRDRKQIYRWLDTYGLRSKSSDEPT